MKAALVCTLLATAALADPRPARDTADIGKKGDWSVGVFAPLKVAFGERVEVQGHPLLFLVAPHFDVRFAVIRPNEELPRGVRLTAEAGAAMPTLGMRLLKGTFFPSWATSTNDIGFMLVPHLGLVSSFDVGRFDVLTARVDAQTRVNLGTNNATPLNSFLAPLDLLLAAPTTGFLGRLAVAYDHAFGERLRLRGEVNAYLTGAPPALVVSGVNQGPLAPLDPFIVSAHLGLDIAVFSQSRVVVGVWWANYDQGATALKTGADGFSERVRVRSNNVLPTLDFIWAGF